MTNETHSLHIESENPGSIDLCPGFFTAFRMTEGRGVKRRRIPSHCDEYYVYILTNETHSLYVESESRMWVDLSAEWSEALDSSLRSE